MENLKDLSRLCIHTITTKPWPIEEAIDKFSGAGVKGISVWRDSYSGRNLTVLGDKIRASGLSIVSTVRGGFFPAATEDSRKRAIVDNMKFIEESANLGSPLLVLVCGASVDQYLPVSRDQIKAGIEAILPTAEKSKVKLAIEPLHPMYADTRSAINTMKQANDMVEYFDSPFLGVAVDVYHVWWDPELQSEIQRCGYNNNLFAFHICDWLTPTEDILNDRGLMGEGCIPIRQIRNWVEEAGFSGFNEVEIFSNRLWAGDQDEFLKYIISAYLEYS
jgi:sugar phosphate isomerase/epimerase